MHLDIFCHIGQCVTHTHTHSVWTVVGYNLVMLLWHKDIHCMTSPTIPHYMHAQYPHDQLHTTGWAIKVVANSLVGSYNQCAVAEMAKSVVDVEIHSLSKESLQEWLLKNGVPQGVADALYGMLGTV